jgi:8-oxo-dGTP pyrophosphatase MutT (NUDIX family)
MRHTIRGIIIKDRKVLLVIGHEADFYWTPGGGVEAGETIEETLCREIKEELGVTVRTLELYYSYDYEDQKVDNFLIEIEGDIKTGSEITGTSWYSSGSTIKLSRGFRDMVLPRLLQDGLID